LTGGQDPARMERNIGFVLRAGVMISSICLACGLVATLASVDGVLPRILLHTGLIVLLATPVLRVVVATAQYVIQRDWTFASLTAIVLVELLASALAALVFNKRL
jgi:uncharacterized membrane protein